MARKNIDMCSGPLLGKMLRYTVPIILTGVLQLLFNAADLIIVGRFGSSGSNAVAAVVATSALSNLIINFSIGCSVGSGVTVAQAIGSKNEAEIQKSVHTAIPIALVGGLVLSVFGVIFSKPLLRLMSTPEEIINLSDVYMKIVFAAMIFSMLYNFGAAILRAAGDTKRPLIYLIISGALNVILNIFFVTVLSLDVAGVAIATAISQMLSAVLVLLALIRRTDACRLCLKKLRFHIGPLKKILKIGIPAGIQGCLFSISNVMIQSSINSLSGLSGLVAGNSAASNIEGFVYTTMNSFYQTTLNFTGQNVGAQKYNRVRRIYIIALAAVAIVGAVLGALVYSQAEPLLSLYITDSAKAIKWGTVKLFYVCLPYFMCGLMEVSTGALRGMGVSLAPMLISVLGVCGLRMTWILTVFKLPQYHTPQGLYISYILSWTVTFLLEMISFIIIYKKRKKETNKSSL